jgi:hypothetical protein
MAFGEGADWYRNIVAAGGATLRRHGTEHQLREPAAIDPDSATSPFPGWQRPVFRALGIRRFLFLKGQERSRPSSPLAKRHDSSSP